MQKKSSLVLSLLVLAAMLLAACSSSNNNNQNGAPGAATTGTPAVNSTVPAAGVTGTPAAGNPAATATVAGTPVAGTPLAATPAAGTPAAGTPAAGTPALTGTPGAVIPQTSSANVCQFNRLTKLVGMTVVDQANAQLGTIQDVVVARDTSVFNSSTGTANNGTTSNGTTNSGGTGSVVMPANPAAAPMVEYVVVGLNSDNGGKSVLLPFSAIKFTAAQASNQAAMATATAQAAFQATAQVATPATGPVTVTGTPTAAAAANSAAANSAAATTPVANACVATLDIPASGLANLPGFDASKVDFTTANWEQPYTTPLANLGLSIPATGAQSKYGASVLLGNKVDSIHVKDANNNDLGTVQDFIINPANSQFSYVALGSGGFLGIGQKNILIPISALSWVSGGKNDATGILSTNLSKEQVQAAPAVDNLDKVDFASSTWDQGLVTYWKSLGVTTGQQVATPGAPPSK